MGTTTGVSFGLTCVAYTDTGLVCSTFPCERSGRVHQTTCGLVTRDFPVVRTVPARCHTPFWHLRPCSPASGRAYQTTRLTSIRGSPANVFAGSFHTNNLARPHQSLQVRVRGPSRCRHRTPAMAAGLTGQRWSVRKILLMPLLPQGHVSRSLLAA